MATSQQACVAITLSIPLTLATESMVEDEGSRPTDNEARHLSEFTFKFNLSRRLVQHLDDRNPRLIYSQIPMTREPLDSTSDVPRAIKVGMRKWRDACILRTPGNDDVAHVQDVYFLWSLMPRFSRDMLQHYRLLLRIRCMENQLYALNLCSKSISDRFANPLQAHPKSATLKEWSLWSLQPLKFSGMVTDTDDEYPGESSRPLTIGEHAQINRVWQTVFSYTNFARQDDVWSRPQTHIWPYMDISDELCPIWYLVLSELGYSTGTPIPAICPSLCDTACLPLRLLDPTNVRQFMDRVSAKVKASNARLLTPIEFLGLITRLRLLAQNKKTAMNKTLQRKSPSLAVLMTGGFATELMGIASILHQSDDDARRGFVFT